jgi:hypothetical protein
VHAVFVVDSGTRTGISSTTEVFPLSINIPPLLHTHPSSSTGTVGLFEAYCKGTRSHLTPKMMMKMVVNVIQDMVVK